MEVKQRREGEGGGHTEKRGRGRRTDREVREREEDKGGREGEGGVQIETRGREGRTHRKEREREKDTQRREGPVSSILLEQKASINLTK